MFDEQLQEALGLLKNIDGYGEIRLEERRRMSISVKNGIVEHFARTSDMGGFVRILLNGHGWGVATFNSIESLANSFGDAKDSSAAIIPDEQIRIAEGEPYDAKIENKMDDPFDAHSDDEKVELMTRYNELMRSHGDEIMVARNGYTDVLADKLFVNNLGMTARHSRRDGWVTGIARAKRGNDIQQSMVSFNTMQRFSDLTEMDEKMNKAARNAIDLLDAKSVNGGKYAVVLNQKLAGVFIHEAFGHLSEADFLLENPQAQEMMTLGRRFGQSFLNVFDDGTIEPTLRGTIHYDDEGTPANKTYLIKNGVLIGRLHNRETAAKLGEEATGNARAEDFHQTPLVRMTNTAIEQGEHPTEQIFDGIKDGVYACDAYGGQTQIESFSFSAGHGYMIRNGKVEEMVKDVVLQGNLFNTLINIDAIGDDFMWNRMAGACGKGGQSMFVDTGAPHIRIQGVTIGGK